MDYEKAYKASLKTAAQWIKDGCTDKEKICLECVFPELRESEDERIRMKLFHTVRGTPKDDEWFEEISKEAMLAWLEKQKDSKVCAEKSKNFTIQKEQKPAGWSKATINGEPIPTENHSVDIPLAEWSEEDEKLRRNLMSLLANMRGDRITEETYQKYYPWLKSLRPQSNTVSVENATKFGNLEYERGVKDGIQSEKSRQWKPTYEQLEALRKAVNKLADTEVATSVNLSILYDHLKELM